MTTRPRINCSRGVRNIFAVVVPLAIVLASGLPVSAEPGPTPIKYLPAANGAFEKDVLPFADLSCPTTATCVATGGDYGATFRGGSKAEYDTLSSGVWSAPSLFSLPSDFALTYNSSPEMSAVSCWNVGDCAAVGGYTVYKDVVFSGVATVPMVALETAGSWSTPTRITLPTETDSYGQVSSVSCVSSGNCTAVGDYVVVNPVNRDFVFHGFVITESAGIWSTAVDLPPLPGESTGDFQRPISVACTDATDCSYIEQIETLGEAKTFVNAESAGTWGTPHKLAGPLNRPWLGSAISCPAANNCVVVGGDATSVVNLEELIHVTPAFDIEINGGWSPAGQLPQPILSPVTNGGAFFSVSCVNTVLCVAGGFATVAPDGKHSVPMLATLSNRRWSSLNLYGATILAGKSRATNSTYDSISCPSSVRCRAIGDSRATTTTPLVYMYSWTNSVVPVITTSLPDPPIAVKAIPQLGTATISWLPPYHDGGSRINLFRVTVTSPGLAKRYCISLGLTCKVVGLIKGHRYVATVTSRNASGTSRPSKIWAFVD